MREINTNNPDDGPAQVSWRKSAIEYKPRKKPCEDKRHADQVNETWTFVYAGLAVAILMFGCIFIGWCLIF